MLSHVSNSLKKLYYVKLLLISFVGYWYVNYLRIHELYFRIIPNVI